MRVQLKVEIDTAAGNKAIKDGSMPKIIMGFVEKYKPEACYFMPNGGDRSAVFYLDLKDVSEIPALVESWWIGLAAKVSLTPCMNAQDLAKGLQAMAK